VSYNATTLLRPGRRLPSGCSPPRGHHRAQTPGSRCAEKNAELGPGRPAKDRASSPHEHELRTPANAISACSEALARKSPPPPYAAPGQVHHHHFPPAACTCSRLINDILDLSKDEAGKLELNLVYGGAAGVL